jgi:VWFA-related protein
MISRARFLVVAALAIIFTTPTGAQQPQQQPPVFRSSVELTSLDVSVVDDRGRAITDLKPDDFTVRVDGSPRRVVNAEWVGLETKEQPPAPPAPDGYTGNENATGGRLIMVVVDEANIRFGGTLGIRSAVNAFIDHLRPSDRAAVIGIGRGAPSTPFTADRARLKRAIERLVGQHQGSMLSQFTITTFEALQIQRNYPGAVEEVIAPRVRRHGGPGIRNLRGGGAVGGVRKGDYRHSRRPEHHRGTARAIERAQDDRRAENDGAHLRRVHSG